MVGFGPNEPIRVLTASIPCRSTYSLSRASAATLPTP